MVCFALGEYLIYIENQFAINLLLSAVFCAGGVFIVVVILSVTKQNVALQESMKSESEKEILLKEIHHRVKNNLQIIISLLRLEKNKLTDEKSVEAITNCEGKVYTMASLHESLYQTEDLSKVNFKSYINSILDNLIVTYANAKPIHKNINICKANFSIDLLIPLGLVMNEIIANSFKHAFTYMDQGEITIHLIETNPHLYKLTVHDSGTGVPTDFFTNQNKGLGSELIFDLVNQIEGTIEIVEFSETKAFEIIFSYR
jgi:two-component sensor histidine kinase